MTVAIDRHSEKRDCLEAAFETFNEVARTLQQSYEMLAARIEQMDLELARSNEALRRQLRENETMRAHLDGILESLSTGVLVVNEQGLITRSNQTAARLLGIEQQELLGRRATVVLARAGLGLGDRPQQIGQAMVAVAETPLRTELGESGGLILIQDITRLYQLEEQVQRKDRLAAMGEMIGRIAHEIRNPLGSIELFASLLRHDLSDQPVVCRYAEQISQAVQAMDRLLANLLAYMKPGRPLCAWHPVEPLILEALNLAAHVLSQAPVEVQLKLDPSIPAIWCHSERMKQVLLNLIVNAVQAMPQGGTLTIGLRDDETKSLGGPAVRLTISDSGVGIDPSIRSRLFDPFFTTRAEGTGLGLAIVHSIVEAHHGRVEVESVVGRGAVFAVVLPHPSVTSSREGDLSCSGGGEENNTKQAEPTEAGTGRLLLVEDTVHD
ncbi:MAG: ATP-binding protein [Nitrospira sp.]|nr:ATP-binding protein [Nitrospira sp.]